MESPFILYQPKRGLEVLEDKKLQMRVSRADSPHENGVQVYNKEKINSLPIASP
ncbi:hypothetical protein PROFUN_15200 [Planoprotostelium fungivorum]|uniref:Uncharacterized protein n=1 Tax=Planoprotostelium fungivorum TaxID=1890364 RepID=A0A2P6MXN6_9EUKA|nr:hypothetical protein PROFUN_15200 [Planoprotostelium fungivorum]